MPWNSCLCSSLCSAWSPAGIDPPKDLAVGNVTENSMTIFWAPPIAAFDHYRISYQSAQGNLPVSSKLYSQLVCGLSRSASSTLWPEGIGWEEGGGAKLAAGRILHLGIPLQTCRGDRRLNGISLLRWCWESGWGMQWNSCGEEKWTDDMWVRERKKCVTCFDDMEKLRSQLQTLWRVGLGPQITWINWINGLKESIRLNSRWASAQPCIWGGIIAYIFTNWEMNSQVAVLRKQPRGYSKLNVSQHPSINKSISCKLREVILPILPIFSALGISSEVLCTALSLSIPTPYLHFKKDVGRF